MPEHKSAKALASPLFSRKTISIKISIQITFIRFVFLECCKEHSSRADCLYWSMVLMDDESSALWSLLWSLAVDFCIALCYLTRTGIG